MIKTVYFREMTNGIVSIVIMFTPLEQRTPSVLCHIMREIDMQSMEKQLTKAVTHRAVSPLV